MSKRGVYAAKRHPVRHGRDAQHRGTRWRPECLRGGMDHTIIHLHICLATAPYCIERRRPAGGFSPPRKKMSEDNKQPSMGPGKRKRGCGPVTLPPKMSKRTTCPVSTDAHRVRIKYYLLDRVLNSHEYKNP